MRLTMTAAALAGALFLAGCGGGDDEGDAVTAPEPTPAASASAAAGVPKDDTERLCRAATTEIELHTKKLQNAADDIAAEDPSGYAEAKADLEKGAKSLDGWVDRYPDADEDLAADVTEVAKLWRKAVGQLSADTAEEFTKTMAQILDAQEKVTAACG